MTFAARTHPAPGLPRAVETPSGDRSAALMNEGAA